MDYNSTKWVGLVTNFQKNIFFKILWEWIVTAEQGPWPSPRALLPICPITFPPPFGSDRPVLPPRSRRERGGRYVWNYQTARLRRDRKVGIGFKTTGPTNQNSTLWSQRRPELTNEQIWVRCAKPVGCVVRSVCAGKRDGCQQCVFATITLASTHTAATLSWIETVTACFAHFIYIYSPLTRIYESLTRIYESLTRIFMKWAKRL